MADHGLEVWDENGNKTLSVTDRITKFIGTFQTGTANGSLNVGGNVPINSDIWFFIDGVGILNTSTNVFAPNIVLNGTTFSWSFEPSEGKLNTTIKYGIY